jgi:hypothetical protein
MHRRWVVLSGESGQMAKWAAGGFGELSKDPYSQAFHSQWIWRRGSLGLVS